ncbi:MAG: alginate export family protein [Pseudomonadota bacterium]
MVQYSCSRRAISVLRIHAAGAVVALLLLCAGAPSRAQDVPTYGDLALDFGEARVVGDVRLRSSLDASRDLSSQPDLDARFPVLARVGAEAAVAESYAARVLLGAVGELGLRREEPALFVDEAWVEARTGLLGGLARLRFGRQALELQDGRLVSSEAFVTHPRRVDALRGSASIGDLELESFLAILSTALAAPSPATDTAPDDLLGGVLASYQLGSWLRVGGHILGQLGTAVDSIDIPAITGDERTPLRILTLGLEARACPLTWLEAVAALSLQVGEARALEQQAVDLHLHTQAAVPGPGQPTLRLGYDLAGGDRNPFDLRSNSFRNPLGARHARFGASDLLAPRNAQDLFVALRIQEQNSWAELSLHRLQLDSTREAWLDGEGREILAAPAGDEHLLGYDLDVAGHLAVHPQLSVELLYALFLPDGVARTAVGNQAAHRLLLGVLARF